MADTIDSKGAHRSIVLNDVLWWKRVITRAGLLSGKNPDPGYNIHVYRLQTKSQTSAAQLRRHNKHGDDVERPPSRAIDRLFSPHRMQYTHKSHVTTTIFTLTQSRTFVAQMTRDCYAMNVQRHLSWMWREISLRWTIKNKTCDWQQRQKKTSKENSQLVERPCSAPKQHNIYITTPSVRKKLKNSTWQIENSILGKRNTQRQHNHWSN